MVFQNIQPLVNLFLNVLAKHLNNRETP